MVRYRVNALAKALFVDKENAVAEILGQETEISSVDFASKEEIQAFITGWTAGYAHGMYKAGVRQLPIVLSCCEQDIKKAFFEEDKS